MADKKTKKHLALPETTPAAAPAPEDTVSLWDQLRSRLTGITEEIDTAFESLKAVNDCFSGFSQQNISALFSALDIFVEMGKTGALDDARDVAKQLTQKGYSAIEPADSVGVISFAARRANAEGKKLLNMLPAFMQNAAAAAQQGITIYDLLRSYSLGKDFDKPTTLKAIKAETMLYPVDVANSKVWQGLAPNIQHQLKAEKDGSKQELSILYSINFEELGNDIAISKELTKFDKRVYIAAAALYNAGNKQTTLTQIYSAMGYTSKPSQTTLAQINNSLSKMQRSLISISNKEQASVYNYPLFVYDAALLPFERLSITVNGKTTDAAIHFFRQPPLITFARERKQITTINIKLLQIPLSMTEQTLAITDYLIQRIARASKTRQPQRILYKTLYENADIDKPKQKQRATEKIKIILEHFKKEKFIAGYSLQQDGITVRFAQASLPNARKS